MEMKRYIELDLEVDGGPVVKTIKWELVNETYALFWFKCLHQLVKNRVPSFFRLTGLNRSTKNAESLSDQLNIIITLINRNTDYKIEQFCDGRFSQEFANSIHHHFELLYGDAHNPSELYSNASPLIRSAITKINHLIHDMEALSRVEEGEAANKAIVSEFLSRPQYKMQEEFLKSFSLNIDFGDMVLHYGIIGKSWWEVFLDQDEAIHDEAIRPLSFMSGEFDIHFSKIHPKEEILNEFYDFLKKRGLDKNDPSLCLGYLKLACLDLSQTSKLEIDKFLEKEIRLQSLRLKVGEEVVEEMSLIEDDMAEQGFFQINSPLKIEQSDLIPLKKTSVQLIPLIPEKGGVRLSGKVFRREWQGFEHCVSLMGTSDTDKVYIEPSDGEIDVRRTVSLGEGEILELAYDIKENRYVAISSKK
jgi:hypothetical protein